MILPAIMLLFTLLLRLSCSPFPSGHYLVISLRGGYREIISRWKEREKDPMGFSVHLQTTSPTSLPPWHHPTLSQTTNQYSALPLFLFLLIHLSFFLPLSFLPSHALSFFPCLCPSFYHSYIVLHALRHNNNSAWFLVCSLLDLWAWSYVKKILKSGITLCWVQQWKKAMWGFLTFSLPFIIFSPLNNVTYVLWRIWLSCILIWGSLGKSISFT